MSHGKASLLVASVALFGSPCVAQTADGSRWAIEVSGGPTTFRESYPTDCCGPPKRANASSFTVRAVGRVNRSIALGAERGETNAEGWHITWRMPVITVSRRDHFAPWLELGVGAVSQIGECPADGSRPDPACGVDRTLGGQLAAGLRLRLAPHLSLGGEIGIIRGSVVRDRYVSSQRFAIALRWD